MNIHPFFTTRRSFLVYKFSKLRARALNDAYRSILTGSKSTLEVFPGSAQRISPRLKLIGVRDIRVAEFVGTFNRDTDFDSQFRPLKRHSLDRWVNAHILREQDGWSPPSSSTRSESDTLSRTACAAFPWHAPPAWNSSRRKSGNMTFTPKRWMPVNFFHAVWKITRQRHM